MHPLDELAQDTLGGKVVVTGATEIVLWLFLILNLSHVPCHMRLHAVSALKYLAALRALKSRNMLRTRLLTLKACGTWRGA